MSPHDDLMAGGAALSIEGVSKAYSRESVALQDVSLGIGQGTSTAIVGPNGAGKTTLMKLWVGFERPTAGTVNVMGHDPWSQRGRALAHIGYVPQTPALYRELTVRDHLDLSASLRPGFDRAFAASRLGDLGIDLQRRAVGLSGGQQAQVALTLALGTRGEVLLLDEPLASLDPLARREFLSLVSDVVRSERSTLVLSSHVITDIIDVCQRLIVLAAGRVLLDDEIATILTRHWIADATSDLSSHPAVVLVGGFPGPAGGRLRLYKTTETGPSASCQPLRRATLEEVVLGYLARQAPAA